MTSGLSLLKSELSFLLTQKNPTMAVIEQRMKAARLELPLNGVFQTLLIKVFPSPDRVSKEISGIKDLFTEVLEKACFEKGFSCIFSVKDSHNVIVHLYTGLEKKHLFTSEKLNGLCRQIAGALEVSYKYFMSLGKKVFRISDIHESYETAASNMKKAFFKGYNCIIASTEGTDGTFVFETALLQEFKAAIEKQDRTQVIFFIKNLTSDLKRFVNTPVHIIKDFYFKLLLELARDAEKLLFGIMNDPTGKQLVWEYFFKINTLEELEKSLLNYVNKYFNNLEERNSSDRVLHTIVCYIKENYGDESLSITKISEHVHLAPTYLCSLFKKKTGTTLNQYITGYRIEKSKELLLNKNIKISDISSMIGLRDQGYFAKLFRKTTGMTPSEYILGKKGGTT